MIALFVIQEIAMILFYLSLPVFLFYFSYSEQKKNRKIIDEVVNKLVELADDEKPIVLTVDTKNLTKKVVEEMEKEKSIKRW